MAKTLEENFIDWEATAFGYGYGTGEPLILPALKTFLENCNAPGRPEGCYSHETLEKVLDPTVAWLLINALARHPVDMIDYGSSPRFGWLNAKGLRLKAFVESKTADELVDIVTEHDEPYTPCYPDACNCGPHGYEKGRVCQNPFWLA